MTTAMTLKATFRKALRGGLRGRPGVDGFIAYLSARGNDATNASLDDDSKIRLAMKTWVLPTRPTPTRSCGSPRTDRGTPTSLCATWGPIAKKQVRNSERQAHPSFRDSAPLTSSREIENRTLGSKRARSASRTAPNILCWLVIAEKSPINTGLHAQTSALQSPGGDLKFALSGRLSPNLWTSLI